MAMKPERSDPRPLALFALASLGFLILCLHAASPAGPEGGEAERKAIALAKRAQAIIGDRLIGPEYTPITTTLAPLEAKRLSTDPRFAAVAFRCLKEAGIGPGDRVALNFTGSFPALDIAVLAAVTAIGARPVLVSSVGASTYGATDPDFTWLDMERAIAEAGVWPWRSRAASIGGARDRGNGLFPEGVELAEAAIRRSGVPALRPADARESVALRARIFEEDTGTLPPVLVNVGGSLAFFGPRGHRAPLREGLTRGYHPGLALSDGLAALFLRSNRPVIHFINVKRLAARYGIRQGDAPADSGGLPPARREPLAMKVLIAFWIVASFAFLHYGRRRGWWRGPVR